MAPTNGWRRFPGGAKIALAYAPGKLGAMVQPGGVHADGLVTMYVGQRRAWKCLALDPATDEIVGVGHGTSQEKARAEAIGT
jgi:hypothetical protein